MFYNISQAFVPCYLQTPMVMQNLDFFPFNDVFLVYKIISFLFEVKELLEILIEYILYI